MDRKISLIVLSDKKIHYWLAGPIIASPVPYFRMIQNNLHQYPILGWSRIIFTSTLFQDDPE